MPPSESSHRSHPPRQKSCHECFKSKRRCNRAYPKCTRCSKQNLQCTYVATPISPEGFDENNIELVVPPGIFNSDLPEGHVCQAPESGSMEESTSDHDMTFAPNGNRWPNLLPAGNELDPESTSLIAVQDSQVDFEVYSLLDSSPISKEVYAQAITRLHYSISTFKRAPLKFVSEMQTPWMHPQLYAETMPRSISDAFSACSSYIHMNEQNQRVVHEVIDSRVEDLFKAPKDTTPIEMLARVQAILLYQIIRFFDGNTILRTKAESSLSELEFCSFSLLGILDKHAFEVPHDTDAYSIAIPWKSWIFIESVRRTLLITFFFLACCAVLSNGPCQKSAFVGVRPWTLSAPLWNAQSSSEFDAAWVQQKYFVIRNMDFGEVYASASPQDVDEFGKVFMIASEGIGNVRQWYHQRGAIM